MKRSLSVRATLVGSPAFGYRTGRTLVEPPRVEVSGPLDEINAIEELKTVPVDLHGRTASFEQRPLLEWVGDFVTFVPDRVTVAVIVQERPPVRGLHVAGIGLTGGRYR